MEQKKILWITLIVGIFLLIVTGIALVLYTTTDSRTPVIASVPVQEDVWVKPLAQEPAPTQQQVVPDNLNVDNIQAQTITVNTLDIRNITGTALTEPEKETTAAKAPEENVATPQKSASTKTNRPAKKVSVAKTKPAAKKTASVSTAAAKAKTAYWIQAASFTDKLKAEAARDELGKRLVTPNIFTKEQNGVTYYRVRIGPYTTQKEAEYWLAQFKSIKGFEQSFISQTGVQK